MSFQFYHAWCGRFVPPRELVTFFLRHNIPLESYFHYNLKDYCIRFSYDSMFTNNDIHIDEFHEIFDVFPNVVLTGISMKGSRLFNALGEMFGMIGIQRCEYLEYVNIDFVGEEKEGMNERLDLDVSILAKCKSLKYFSAENYELENVEALLECSKLRTLKLRKCRLNCGLDLNVFERIRGIVWIDVEPVCDFWCVRKMLRKIGIGGIGRKGGIEEINNKKFKHLKSLMIENGWENERVKVERLHSLSLVGPNSLRGVCEIEGEIEGVKKFKIKECDELSVVQFEGLHELDVRKCRNFIGVTMMWYANLRVVTIMDCPELGNIEGLRGCKGLEIVDIKRCAKLCVDFLIFSDCEQLSVLSVMECEEVEGLYSVREHKKLKKFIVYKVKGLLSVNDLCGLDLEEVMLGCSIVTNCRRLGEMGEMGEMEGLKWIGLGEGCGNLDLKWLGKCQNLRNLMLYELDIVSLVDLGSCERLENVYIIDCKQLESVRGIECEHLYLRGCEKILSLEGLGGKRLKNIIVCGHLSILGFRSKYMHLKNIKILARLFVDMRDICMCPNLEVVQLQECLIFNLCGIESCSKLREFYASNCRALHSLSPLNECRNLRIVSVVNCPMVQEGVKGVGLIGEIMGCNIKLNPGRKDVLKCAAMNAIGFERIKNLFRGMLYGIGMLWWWKWDVPSRFKGWISVGGLNEYQLYLLGEKMYDSWRKRDEIMERIKRCDMMLLVDSMWVIYFAHKLWKSYYDGTPLICWRARV